MENTREQSDYWANITKIVNFFRNTPQSGFLFCACNNQRMVQEINRQIIENAKHHELTVGGVYISYDDIDNVLSVLRKGVQESPNGIILNNMDELIERTDGRFIKDINMGREILIEMGVPMVFWLSEENISRFANQATDLFNRRDRSVVVFSDLSGVPASMERLDGFYELGFKSTEDYSSLKLKIGLMEKQLQEAKKKNYSEERIAIEIAADLIELYLNASLYPEAYRLFEEYRSYFENAFNVKFLNLCGDVYFGKSEWDKALKYYLKLKQIGVEVFAPQWVGTIYNKIGEVYRNKGEWRKALSYYLNSEQIGIQANDQIFLGSIYNNIGLTYTHKGELEKALTYLIKSERIFLKFGNQTGLSSTYNNIASIYFDKGEMEKSLEYDLKSEQIRIESGDRRGLGYTYNNIGAMYGSKGEFDKALEYYLKSEQIRIEVGDRGGLAYTYLNIGSLYKKKDDKEKADLHFILAGYIAKTLGMEHELSQWSSALNPLIEEMGEERFMEEGKRLLEERLKDVPANL